MAAKRRKARCYKWLVPDHPPGDNYVPPEVIARTLARMRAPDRNGSDLLRAAEAERVRAKQNLPRIGGGRA